MPYLGLEREQPEEAPREESDVSVGDALLWGAPAGATNDDSVCRQRETEVSQPRATADAIETAESGKGCNPEVFMPAQIALRASAARAAACRLSRVFA